MGFELKSSEEMAADQPPEMTLTEALILWLQRENSTAPSAMLEEALRQLFSDRVVFITTTEKAHHPLFVTDTMTRALDILQGFSDHSVHQAIAILLEAIAVREERGDPWPEGRLNLGIAYAQLGDYHMAQRWLHEAYNILRYPDYGHGAKMAA